MNALVKLGSFFCKDIPKEFDQLNLWQKLWLIFPVAALFSSLVFLIAVIVFAHDFGIFNGESLLFLISALLVLPIPSIIYRIGRVIGNWMALRKSKRNHQNRSTKPKPKRRNNHNSRQPSSGRSRSGSGGGRPGNNEGRSRNNRGRSRNQRNNRD